MQEIALGYLGWSIDQFWDALPREFMNAYRGKLASEERQHRTTWEASRWVAAVLLGPHLKKGSKLNPTDLAKFPWEKTGKEPTKAERLERLKRL